MVRSHASAMPGRAARRRTGMSLVELIVALGILGGALLALAMFTPRFAHSASLSSLQSTAVGLAVDRIETVKSYNNYSNLETAFVGTEPTIASYPGFSRQTLITRVGGTAADSIDDYKAVTVIITNPQLTSPVKKTTFIAAY